MSKYRDKVRRRAGLPPEPSPPRTRTRVENRQYLDPETPDTSKFTPEVEAHIQGYLERMDPRPWTQGWSTHHVVRHGDGYPVLESHHGASGQGAAYIVNAMPAILAHIKELEAKVAVSGGDFCRESRAKGCNPCGCCALCVSEAQARIRDLEGALKVCGECRGCNGKGSYMSDCSFCGDSTYDHECDDERVKCGMCNGTGMQETAARALKGE